MSAVLGAGQYATASKPPTAVHARLRDLLLDLIRKSFLFQFGVAVVVIDLFLAAFGPIIEPESRTVQITSPNLAPSTVHFFGTDPSGLDVFARVLAAPRVDVTIAVAATMLGVIGGTILGLLATVFSGWASEIFVRVADTVQALPGLAFVFIIVILAGRSNIMIVLILGLLQVPIYLRLIRSQVLSLRERPFVEAAIANGNTPISTALRHILPNALTPALAQASITMGFTLLAITGLSFIGAGVRPPTAEWGGMIQAGAQGINLGQWWMFLFPGLAISFSVFGFAAVGEGLQRALAHR